MDKIQKLLLKTILKDEDANQFLYNKKNIHHGNRDKIRILFLHIETQLNIEDMKGK